MNPFVRALKTTRIAELGIERAIHAEALKSDSHFGVNGYRADLDFDGIDVLLRLERSGRIHYVAIAIVSGSATLENGKINSLAAVAARHKEAEAPYFLLVHDRKSDRYALYSAADILESKTSSLRPKDHEFMPANDIVDSMISIVNGFDAPTPTKDYLPLSLERASSQ
jgi:hypothetical protein